MTEPPAWPPEIEAALQTASEPAPLANDRKAALWRRIEETTAVAPPSRRGPRLGRLGWIAGAVAVAAVLLLWLGTRQTPGGGTLEAVTRASIVLRGRGIAVAEPGAKLRWDVDAQGTARVTQSEGLVFYRVEPGGAFTVSTPVGQVDVTGTSFEVEMNNKMIGSAAAGGALAAAMVVAVYEGNVVASNAHGQVEVTAGERVEILADRRPEAAGSRFADDGVQGGAGEPESFSSAQQLKNRVRELEIQLAEARADSRDAERKPDDDNDDDDDWHARLFEPTQAMLEDSAKHCRVHWATPAPRAHGDAPLLSDEVVTKIGLTPKERAAIDALAAELNDGVVELARELYVEATGDEAGVSDLSFAAMRSEIFDKAPKRDAIAARTQISREVAGLAERPADPATDALTTRMMRAEAEHGRQYSEGLSRVLGVERARQVRRQLPLAVNITEGCEDSE